MQGEIWPHLELLLHAADLSVSNNYFYAALDQVFFRNNGKPHTGCRLMPFRPFLPVFFDLLISLGHNIALKNGPTFSKWPKLEAVPVHSTK